MPKMEQQVGILSISNQFLQTVIARSMKSLVL